MTDQLKELSRQIRRPWNRYRAFKRLAEYHSRPRDLEDVVDWAINFGGGGLYTVKTLQVRSEIIALARAVADLKPRNILEIGTARGGTLLIWASIASERVISCDLRDMRIPGELYTQFSPTTSKCRITLMSGDSHDDQFVQRVAGELGGDKVDMLFIDGDHREAGVEQDYENYRQFVRPGGIIAFHDIVENQPLPENQVYYFWKRLRERENTQEFVDNPDQCGFGIGIVRVAG